MGNLLCDPNKHTASTVSWSTILLYLFGAAGSRYGDSPESDEELSLLGDTIVREALSHATDTSDIRDTDSVGHFTTITYALLQKEHLEKKTQEYRYIFFVKNDSHKSLVLCWLSYEIHITVYRLVQRIFNSGALCPRKQEQGWQCSIDRMMNYLWGVLYKLYNVH